MIFHDEQLRIIKELFCKQQENPTQERFTQILNRLDQMISEMIIKFSRIYYFEETMPQLLQDLYQTAIVGLGIAIQRFDSKKEAKSIPIWVFHCIRNELFRVYRHKSFDPKRYLYEHPDYTEDSGANSKFLSSDIQRIIRELIQSGDITDSDYHLMILYYVQNLGINEILRIFGDRWGKTRSTIKKKIEKISRKLKEEFVKRGLDD